MSDLGDLGRLDDAAMGSSADVDLSPRQLSAPKRRRRPVLAPLLIAAIAVVLGFVVVRTLNDAALFFYNADDAIEQRDDLEGQRFRVQGTPFGATGSAEIERDGRLEPAVVFTIAFEEATIDVVHTGNPAELFQPGVPVVLEGQWRQGLPDGITAPANGAGDGWHFASTDMVVKHDNEYRNSNGDRLVEAEQGGTRAEP